jgi:hypothetical protein
MYYRMVRTRQGARTDPSPVRGNDQSSHYKSDSDWDLLADTSSHVPATLVHSKRGGLIGLQDDTGSRQAEVSLPDASDKQGGDNVPPLVALAAASNPFSDLAFIDHIVRAVIARMAVGSSSTALRPREVVTIVINNPTRPGSNHREVNCINYKQQ